ncbi:hypothetical protein [Bradyrhizobium canariense]|uniref:hypothetical protein n=1 Tax=Bradyrhizobium canariense TaxID=255045 RepID=UPI001FCD0BCD|nr:hypothetical protein [Bradyrhizobium canariense]
MGMALRAIGRGFGSGTFAVAAVASADNARVSTRLVANAFDKTMDKAVDRKAAARVNWLTAFLRGESSIDDALSLID